MWCGIMAKLIVNQLKVQSCKLSFLFINKTLGLTILKTRTAMNAKISVFVICVGVIINLILYNLRVCTFK